MIKVILVVQDDVLDRNLLVKTLIQEDYEVLEAASAAEALHLSRNVDGSIHLLVANEFLKTLTGRELFEQLRQSRPGLQLLHLSSNPWNKLEKGKGLVPGAEFLQKPFSPEALAEKITQIEGPKAMVGRPI